VVPILEHLSVGPYADALAAPDDVDAFLNVAEEHDLPPTDRPAHKVPMTDMQPIPVDQLEEAVRWLDAHLGAHHVYLFCNAGVGRSPSVAVAYLCCVQGHSFGEAVEFVARRKPNMSVLPYLIERIDAVRARRAGG
jgi:protein-tyrosine phosphatase